MRKLPSLVLNRYSALYYVVLSKTLAWTRCGGKLSQLRARENFSLAFSQFIPVDVSQCPIKFGKTEVN